MTKEQFLQLLEHLRTLPSVRDDIYLSLVYRTVEYNGLFYLIPKSENKNFHIFIKIGYHVNSDHPKVNEYHSTNIFGESSQSLTLFDSGSAFVCHNVKGPAYATHKKDGSFKELRYIFGNLIPKTDFQFHPLVIEEEKKKSLKKKIDNL